MLIDREWAYVGLWRHVSTLLRLSLPLLSIPSRLFRPEVYLETWFIDKPRRWIAAYSRRRRRRRRVLSSSTPLYSVGRSTATFFHPFAFKRSLTARLDSPNNDRHSIKGSKSELKIKRSLIHSGSLDLSPSERSFFRFVFFTQCLPVCLRLSSPVRSFSSLDV